MSVSARGRVNLGDRTRVATVGLAVSVIALWEVAGRLAGTLLLPPASATAAALARLLVMPEFYAALWTSHHAFALGFLAAASLGIPVGLALGRWPTAGLWFRPHLQVLLVTPASALIPLIIVVAGLSVWTRAFVVFTFAFPLIVAMAESGMREVDGRLLDLARVFGATPWQVLWRVRLPGAWPAVVAGVRMGLARAFSGMVVGELVLMAAGVGGLILRFQADFDAAAVYAVVLVVIAEAVVLMRIGSAIERRVLIWQDRTESA